MTFLHFDGNFSQALYRNPLCFGFLVDFLGLTLALILDKETAICNIPGRFGRKIKLSLGPCSTHNKDKEF